jgi:hypothetical protein
MVSDPRISVAQAAQIPGKTPAQVYGLVTLGRLRRRGEPNKFRGLLLSDVLQWRDGGDLMKVTDAAKLLGGTANDVRRLIAEGKLTLVPGSQRLVYETDVRELSRTWTGDPGPSRDRPLGRTGTSTRRRRRRSSASASPGRASSRPPSACPRSGTAWGATGARTVAAGPSGLAGGWGERPPLVS